MARINAKLGFVTVIEKEEEENLDVNEAMMEDTINLVSKFETEYLTTASQTASLCLVLLWVQNHFGPSK